ncbi:970_t:CDS:1, partial [Scutellospora calospora]
KNPQLRNPKKISNYKSVHSSSKVLKNNQHFNELLVLYIDHKEYLKIQIRKKYSFVCDRDFRYLVKNNIWRLKYIASKLYVVNKKYEKFQDLIKKKVQNDNDNISWSQELNNRNTLNCHSINYSDKDFGLKPS